MRPSADDKNAQTKPETAADWWSRFGKLLDEQEEWPAAYTFKFIAPADRVSDVAELLGGPDAVRLRPSSKGSYSSITAVRVMPSSEAVIAVYETVGEIDGVIAL
jgi:putative lipoic acid-binding regulatory protein